MTEALDVVTHEGKQYLGSKAWPERFVATDQWLKNLDPRRAAWDGTNLKLWLENSNAVYWAGRQEDETGKTVTFWRKVAAAVGPCPGKVIVPPVPKTADIILTDHTPQGEVKHFLTLKPTTVVGAWDGTPLTAGTPIQWGGTPPFPWTQQVTVPPVALPPIFGQHTNDAAGFALNQLAQQQSVLARALQAQRDPAAARGLPHSGFYGYMRPAGELQAQQQDHPSELVADAAQRVREAMMREMNAKLDLLMSGMMTPAMQLGPGGSPIEPRRTNWRDYLIDVQAYLSVMAEGMKLIHDQLTTTDPQWKLNSLWIADPEGLCGEARRGRASDPFFMTPSSFLERVVLTAAALRGRAAALQREIDPVPVETPIEASYAKVDSDVLIEVNKLTEKIGKDRYPGEWGTPGMSGYGVMDVRRMAWDEWVDQHALTPVGMDDEEPITEKDAHEWVVEAEQARFGGNGAMGADA